MRFFTVRPILFTILALAASSSALHAQRTRLISFDAAGAPSTEVQPGVSLSADGRHIAYVVTKRVRVGSRWQDRDQIAVVDRITGEIRMASSTMSGEASNGNCAVPTISAGGRYVAFVSFATNLHPAAGRLSRQVFVKDMLSGAVLLASTDTSGLIAVNGAEDASISSRGREVAFTSWSDDLAVGDTNGTFDVFIKVIENDRIRLASVSTGGTQANGSSRNPTISPDGDRVAFISYGDNLVPGDNNGDRNLFVHDFHANTTVMVDVDANGLPADSLAQAESAMNWGGRFVAFTAHDGLVAGDTNQHEDILLRDLQAGVTTVLSVTSQGIPADGDSRHPSMSPDGRFIAFVSDATNLDPSAPAGWDAYVHDRQTGETRRVSIPEIPGTIGGGVSERSPAVSADGQVVAFNADGSGLLADDRNGLKLDVILHGGPSLAVSGSCPGSFTATVSFLHPGVRVGLIWGELSQVHLRPDSVCRDLLLDVRAVPAFSTGIRMAIADPAGIATFQGMLPAGACGRAYAQAIEIPTCLASNPFPL